MRRPPRQPTRQPPPVAKKTDSAVDSSDSSDKTIAILAGLLFLLVAAFSLAGWYLKPAPAGETDVAFASIGPMALQSRDFTMRTSVAVQSAAEDGSAVAKNRSQLEKFLQIALQNADPALLKSNDVAKFGKLQQQLTGLIQEKYPQLKVQQVWITDFVTSSD